MDSAMSKRTVYVTFFVLINLSFLLTAYEGQAQGVISLPLTGQTKCYNALGTETNCSRTGQDGEIRAGISWPNPRFKIIHCYDSGLCEDQNSDCDNDAANDAVMDNLTGLMWPRSGSQHLTLSGTRTWERALDYAWLLNHIIYGKYGEGSGLCGYEDWRLPNVNELESLVNANAQNPGEWLNSQGFIDIQTHDSYWSSTTAVDTPNIAWYVSMWCGHVSSTDKSQSDHLYVMPIRSGQQGNPDQNFPGNLWKTGQTQTYYSNDDGDLERGVTWPSTRFNDHGNGTVTDNLTGLVWTKDANAPGPAACTPATTKTWQGALDYVTCLNSNHYLGFNNWQLPNRKELFSLIDVSQYKPALPANYPFINVRNSGEYWTSTTISYRTDCAWYVEMWNGYVYFSTKSSNLYVWPVRSGQGSLGYPVISVTPNPVPFGNVNVGATSDKQITVKNDGNANLVIGTITSPTSPFSKVLDNCSGQTLSAGGSCTVTYRFGPTSAASYSSSSNITSNDTARNPVTVMLTGTGTPACNTPGTPSSPSPSDGASGVSVNPTLNWLASSNTNSYDVYFGTSSSNLSNVGNTTGTSYPRAGLTNGTTYYWKVVAKNSCGNSTPGPVWSFTTGAAANLPDFAIYAITIIPDTLIEGDKYTAYVTVTNNGTLSKNGGKLTIWLNQPNTQGCNTSGDKSLAAGALMAGYNTTFTFRNLSAGTPGTKSFRAFIDSKCEYSETDETNNQSVFEYNVYPLVVNYQEVPSGAFVPDEFKDKSKYGWDIYTTPAQPVKSLEKGQSDLINATTEPEASYQGFTFKKTTKGPATVSPTIPSSAEQILTIQGGNQKGTTVFSAVQKNNKKTLSSFKVRTYNKIKKSVSITLVHDTGYSSTPCDIPDETITEWLNAIYSQAMIEWTVVRLPEQTIHFDINNDRKLDVTDWMTEEQQIIRDAFKSNQYDKNIFIVCNFFDGGFNSTYGIMDYNQRYGFVTRLTCSPEDGEGVCSIKKANGAKNIAHELGHGLGLKHCVVAPTQCKDDNFNLMEKGTGILSSEYWRLTESQWDIINP